LADADNAVSISFTLSGAHAVPGVVRDGVTHFVAALGAGTDVAHAPRKDGIEDLVFFDARPAREELVYTVDVSHVAGLRKVNGLLELLDAGGAPRLRVEQPWVLGADGVRHDAELNVLDCAVDGSPVAPWGRPVVAPGASTCRIRVSWSGASYPLVVDPTWSTTASKAPNVYSQGMITLASGKLLVVGGFFEGPSMSGRGPTTNGSLYDPATHTWAAAGSIVNGRSDLVLGALPGGKVIVYGGGGSGRPELYDPATGFSRSQASVSQPAGATATSLDSGLLLVVGGGAVTDAQLYNATSDAFSAAGTLGAARAHHTATKLASGKVLVVGGDGPLSSAELYDPVGNSFAPTGGMAHARAQHVAVKLQDGRVLVAGGGDASAEIYDPAKGTFGPAGTMSTDHVAGQGVLLATGHVMVIAGTAAGVTTAVVDVFDPATTTFETAAPIAVPRSQFTAALLNTNETIVVSGKAASNLSIDSSEVWLPSSAGIACQKKDDCSTALCRGGFCCSATTCTGACRTCAQASGACTPVVSMDDPASCTGTSTCDAKGDCKKKNGQTCGASTDCASAFCVDGVCCDTACKGQCEACDVAAKPGTCSAVLGAPHGSRTTCTSFGAACGGKCNGITTTQCAFPSAVTSCGQSCTTSSLTESTCDGLGACVAEAPHACSGNFTCADKVSCKSSCATDKDCADGYHCDAKKCVPTAVCVGSIVRSAGRVQDCAPYNCDQSGTCRTSCSVVTDCVAPNVCSLGGECVAPSLQVDGGGCSSAPGSTDCSWFAIPVALVLVRRRRRCAS
jgi:hypothetical protein